MSFRFAEPWWLAAIPLAALLFFRPRTPAPSLPFSSLALLDLPAPRSVRLRLRWVPEALRFAVACCIALALARPQTPDPEDRTPPPGRAIWLVFDVSGSVRNPEFVENGRPVSRFEIAQRFAVAFVARLEAGADAVGLVAFAERARVVAPPTRDLDLIQTLLADLELDPRDDRTDIGLALAVPLERLASADCTHAAIVLLTDGAQRAAEGVSPLESARIAAALGVPVHAVDLRTVGGDSDEALLRRIAELTGGEFQRAASPAAASAAAARVAARVPSPASGSRHRRWRNRFRAPLGLALVFLAAGLAAQRVFRVRPVSAADRAPWPAESSAAS
ncbi:MAG TPA: VWA domain-containing protein [Planctomycetia bacterium]|nr:VWA domain-containing protein [Planctomycetia bacterium]